MKHWKIYMIGFAFLDILESPGDLLEWSLRKDLFIFNFWKVLVRWSFEMSKYVDLPASKPLIWFVTAINNGGVLIIIIIIIIKAIINKPSPIRQISFELISLQHRSINLRLVFINICKVKKKSFHCFCASFASQWSQAFWVNRECFRTMRAFSAGTWKIAYHAMQGYGCFQKYGYPKMDGL